MSTDRGKGGMEVAEGRVVSLRYIMRNGRREVLENTMEGSPVAYLQGGEGILQRLQQCLVGCRPGHRQILHLEKGQDGPDDDFSFELIIDGVREALPEELRLGYPLLPPDPACDPDCDCYPGSAPSLPPV